MSTAIEIQDGAVLRDGENVGTVDAQGIFAPAEGLHHKTAESIRKWLAENFGPKTAGGVSENAERIFPPAVPPEGVTPPAPVVPVAPTPPPPVEPVEAAEEIPPAPAQDPRSGDKTPAYVAWLRKYHPAKAAELYANRVVFAE